MKTERPPAEMYEGEEAFSRFQQAVKAVLRVPKAAMPQSPFAQHQKQKPATSKG